MKEEYDFTNAERGKFYRAGAKLIPPVHLEPEIFDYLSDKAAGQGKSLSGLVNDLLRKDIELVESLK